MTIRKNAVAAALAACLLTVCGVAAAQYTTGGGQTGASPPMAPPPAKTTAAPDQAPATTTPATPSMGAQGTTPVAPANQQPTGRMGIPSKTDSAATAFKTLDPMNRGYITKADADKIPGFVGFDSADADRDGHLTYEEFTNAWKMYSGQ